MRPGARAAGRRRRRGRSWPPRTAPAGVPVADGAITSRTRSAVTSQRRHGRPPAARLSRNGESRSKTRAKRASADSPASYSSHIARSAAPTSSGSRPNNRSAAACSRSAFDSAWSGRGCRCRRRRSRRRRGPATSARPGRRRRRRGQVGEHQRRAWPRATSARRCSPAAATRMNDWRSTVLSRSSSWAKSIWRATGRRPTASATDDHRLGVLGADRRSAAADGTRGGCRTGRHVELRAPSVVHPLAGQTPRASAPARTGRDR